MSQWIGQIGLNHMAELAAAEYKWVALGDGEPQEGHPTITGLAHEVCRKPAVVNRNTNVITWIGEFQAIDLPNGYYTEAAVFDSPTAETGTYITMCSHAEISLPTDAPTHVQLVATIGGRVA
ncbi:hypothetical protein O0S10_01790 [Methanocorpusculum sp. MG]|uniref:Uncharacterized protein n=1 Tax=Methanocorpusculum petauri TaxID=3002863 RepID=A0ABT4IDY6_9EURY|nr:hypothetical protein [Methanocorpusculum petauri]MCZ0859959.1 hypothetical protein [Methanocorpusculum petauri]